MATNPIGSPTGTYSPTSTLYSTPGLASGVIPSQGDTISPSSTQSSSSSLPSLPNLIANDSSNQTNTSIADNYLGGDSGDSGGGDSSS